MANGVVDYIQQHERRTCRELCTALAIVCKMQ